MLVLPLDIAPVVRFAFAALLLVSASTSAGATPGPPGAPLAVRALPGPDDTVTLTWEPPQDDGGSTILEYRVYRAPVGGLSSLVGSSPVTTFEDTIVVTSDPGVEVHEYRVTGVNAIGEGPAGVPAFLGTGACVSTSHSPPRVAIDPECLPVRSRWPDVEASLPDVEKTPS